MQRQHPTAKPQPSTRATHHIDVGAFCTHAVSPQSGTFSKVHAKCPVIDSTPQTTQRMADSTSPTAILEEVVDPVEFDIYGLLTIDQAVDLLEIKAGFTRRQAIARHAIAHLRALTRVPVFHTGRGKDENHLAYNPRELLQLLAGPLPTVDQWQAAVQRGRKERALERKLAAMLQPDREKYLAQKAKALTRAKEKALKILARNIPKKKPQEAKASPAPQHRTKTDLNQSPYDPGHRAAPAREYGSLPRVPDTEPIPALKPKKLPTFERR
jgi:hypothetical protein